MRPSHDDVLEPHRCGDAPSVAHGLAPWNERALFSFDIQFLGASENIPDHEYRGNDLRRTSSQSRASHSHLTNVNEYVVEHHIKAAHSGVHQARNLHVAAGL